MKLLRTLIYAFSAVLLLFLIAIVVRLAGSSLAKPMETDAKKTRGDHRVESIMDPSSSSPKLWHTALRTFLLDFMPDQPPTYIESDQNGFIDTSGWTKDGIKSELGQVRQDSAALDRYEDLWSTIDGYLPRKPVFIARTNLDSMVREWWFNGVENPVGQTMPE